MLIRALQSLKMRGLIVALSATYLTLRLLLNKAASVGRSHVCDYSGVFYSPSLKDPHLRVVSGIDLNHGNIAGYCRRSSVF
ncbi:hypothetical protein MRB53_018167 [Persea americana]|uniref:Uncharacterized protein n=1 Tax=Persea americana TaxID=3435 RepID=A0ACC2M7Q5_PERAE|nr:hypothetical protein MRB53_018167 [Persea americana]